jgi:hypothetical protein
MSSNCLPTPPSVEPLWDACQVFQRLGIHRNLLHLPVRNRWIPRPGIERTLGLDPDAIRTGRRSGGCVTPNPTRQEPRPRGSK